MLDVKKGMDCAVKIIKKGYEIVWPILAVAYVSGSTDKIIDAIRYSGNVGYDDAVKAITNSNMYSREKQKAITVLKPGKDSDFYKAIINIAQSSMYSGDKVKVIYDMNCDEKIEEVEEESQA